MAEMEFHLALLLSTEEWLTEDADDLGTCSPGEVEARHGIAVSGRVTRAAFCPSNGGQNIKA